MNPRKHRFMEPSRVLLQTRRIPVWGWFVFGAVVNTLLAYSNLPLQAKLWIGLTSLVVVVMGAARDPHPESREVNRPEDSFWPQLPFGVVGLALAAGLLLRFLGLVSFHGWPLEDESMGAFLAMDLAREWRWDVFPFFAQIPALFFWIFGLFDRWVTPSLSGLWLFPALISTATLAVSFWSARQWFDRRPALWLALLWTVCYWPSFASRYAHPVSLIPFWEVTALGLLGWWNKRLGSSTETTSSLALGLWTGAGFWTTLHWPFVAFWLVCAMLYLTGRRLRRHATAIIAFTAGVLIPVLPLLFAMFHHEFGGYAVSLMGSSAGFRPLDYFLEGFRYVASVFWSGGNVGFGYRPIWGGYLNPLLGTLAMAGIAEAWRQRRKGPGLLLLVGLGLGLLPGFMTRLTEFLRTAHVIPFFILAAFLGLSLLFRSIPSRLRLPVGFAVLVFSTTLDLAHLSKAYVLGGHLNSPWTNGSRSQARARAYSFLEELKRERGPGIVLNHLAPDLSDQSLALAVHAWNVPPESGNASWMAAYLEPDFAKGFRAKNPEGQVRILPEDLHPDQPMALFVLAWQGSPPEQVLRWIQADRTFKSVVKETIAHKEGRGRIGILEAMRGAETAFRGDKILESLYWLRVSDFYRVQSVAGFYHPEILGPGDLQTLRRNLLDKEINALTRSEAAYPKKFAQERLSDLLAIRKSLKRRAVPNSR